MFLKSKYTSNPDQIREIKILVISEFFAPIGAIASIRTTKIVKWLVRNNNYNISVVCQSYDDFIFDALLSRDINFITDIYRIKNNNIVMKLVRLRQDIINKRKQKNDNIIIEKQVPITLQTNSLQRISCFCITYIKKVLTSLESHHYIFKAKKKIKKIPIVDIVITSYGPESSALIGAWYKKKYPEVYWIADFRDPVYTTTRKTTLFDDYYKLFVRNVCKNANAITAVSQGCLDRLYFDEHPRKMVIPNGYDRDDIKDISYKTNDKFTLSYLGSLYSGMRDLSPIFLAISELIHEKKIDPETITIRYAGPSKSDFLSQASLYDMLSSVEANDVVPRIESLKNQLESHMLILATWNNIGEEGIVTGKFLEYMMMDRPIITVVAGNLKDSIVKSMMEKGNLGVCYEEANKGVDHAILKEYILNQYNCYIQHKPLDFHPNQAYIERYNYKNIANEFIALFPKQKDL